MEETLKNLVLLVNQGLVDERLLNLNLWVLVKETQKMRTGQLYLNF
jgi:hypothetical protein